jgi:hypothetical protein
MGGSRDPSFQIAVRNDLIEAPKRFSTAAYKHRSRA